MPQTVIRPSSFDATSDSALVISARRGDQGALTALFARHRRVAASVAARSLSCPADVDDAVAEAFARVFERLDTIRDPARFRPFLLTAVRRVACDRHRRSRRLVLLDDIGGEEIAVGSVEESIEAAESGRRLREAVDALPHRQRYVLRRFFWEDVPVAGIAAEMGLTPNATTQLLFRAKANVATRCGLCPSRRRGSSGQR